MNPELFKLEKEMLRGQEMGTTVFKIWYSAANKNSGYLCLWWI